MFISNKNYNDFIYKSKCTGITRVSAILIKIRTLSYLYSIRVKRGDLFILF